MEATTPTAPTAPPSALDRLGRGAWWLILPVACHIGFSWIGFTPTDDGWMQATARRLLDGEVPHRDFISVRPALSAVLQVPLVLLGGDHVVWLSRLWGWVTIASICWIWTGLAGAQGVLRYVLYGSAVFFSAHTFPVMAWHTIDALLLCSIAVWLANRGQLAPAFLLAGAATLCRQNFAFFAPLLLLAVGGPWRSWIRAGMWASLPLGCYTAALLMLGGGRDFVVQLAAAGGHFRLVALDGVVGKPAWWVGLAVGAALAYRQPSATVRLAAWLAMGSGLILALAWAPWAFQSASLGLLGVVASIGLSARARLLAVAGPGLAWVAMISVGYNNPALMAGVLFLLTWRFLGLSAQGSLARPASLVALAILLFAGAALIQARLLFPYRDQPAHNLEWDAGEVMPGAAGLRTNARVIATLAELRELTLAREASGTPYAILTDISAHWIRSGQRNPLPVDWPQETELGYSPELFDRFFQQMVAMPENSDILVQKYSIAEYAYRLRPIDVGSSYYYAQNYVRLYARKKAETRFFEIYAKPDSYPPAGPVRSPGP